jgi:glycosyltransferase involved in cell wall biosynthesis
MKVLHVIPAVAPRYGGPSHAVVGMARALVSEGVDVLIATTDADGPGRLPMRPSVRLDWQGVPAIFFRRQWSEAFKYSGPLGNWLSAHVADYDAVHVHAVFSHACLAAASACRKRHVPYLVRPLGSLDPWSLRQKPLRKRLLWYAGARRMLHGAAAIHYTTASERRLSEGPLGLRRGAVIPLGVDADLLEDRPATIGDPYVLILGRIHPKKGIDAFIDVFLDVCSAPDMDRWKLVIAGDGEAEHVAALKRLIAEPDCHTRVVFRGWLAGADKAAALRGASLLALPSRQENFGIVVAEALACGTPVLISTEVNLAAEVVEANAGWVTSLDTIALHQTLQQALRDPCELRSRGQAGRELARRQFAWPSVAAQLTSLYRDIVQ